jgi:hypothetical protein
VFEALGFNVAGTCVYASPADPPERWTCCAVLLEQGGLDLQWHRGRPAKPGAAPHASLFRVPRLETGSNRLEGFRFGAAERLTRTWAEADQVSLALRWMSLRERIAPFVLALVDYTGGEHHSDRVPSRLNSARALPGLIFGAAEPGPASISPA